MKLAPALPILSAAAAALAASFVFIPGADERLTMALRDGRHGEAFALLKEKGMRNLTPDQTLTLYRLAVHFGDLRQAAVAIETYTTARPRDMAAQDEKIGFYRHSQDEERYLDSLEAVVERSPSTQRLHELLGARRLRGEVEAERALLAKAVSLGLASQRDLARAGLLEASAGQMEKALALLARLQPAYFSTDSQPQLTQLAILAELGRWPEAHRVALAILEIEPDSSRYHLLLRTLAAASTKGAEDFRVEAEPLLRPSSSLP